MDIVALLLVLACPASLAAFIALVSTGDEMLSIPFLGMALLFLLAGGFLFRLSVGKVLKRFTLDHLRLSRKISNLNMGRNRIISFVNEGGWKNTNLGISVVFDLRGIVFKKTFIAAFVTRALRYPRISNQKPIRYLGKWRLRVSNHQTDVCLEFNSGSSKKPIRIVHNGISTPGLLNWAMTKSRIPPSIEHHRPIGEARGNHIEILNEECFCHF